MALGDGRHADGGGLYLQVKGPSRSWLFVYRWQGRRIEMGLGRYGHRDDEVSLARARDLATSCRRLLNEHPPQSPLDVRRDQVAAARADAAKRRAIPTFGEMATEVLDSLKAGFRNEKHIAQWEMTLKEYAATLRDIPINAIMTDDVLRVLKPIWTEKRETASRLRGRIEKVMDAATAKGFRRDANPARWKGHLDALLPKEKKASRGHHAAMPFADVPELVRRLREVPGTSARALEFTILTGARTGEAIGATWAEFDMAAKVWTVPAERMKAGREHRVPLTGRVVAILNDLMPTEGTPAPDAFVFPGGKRGKSLSNMSMAMVIRRLKIEPEPTVHGFRSSFRDWAGETTTFPREVAEAALAHVVGDQVERAYRRGDALAKRRELMEAWASYLHGNGGEDTGRGILVDFPGASQRRLAESI